MTDVKRSYSDIVVSPLDELDDNEAKKFHTKPGRKPLDTEPKSKRTAQNRAAQRAYRERKERKMKDLEDKVKLLEDQNVRATTETDFLQAQVNILKKELAKYRGSNDFSDLNLPTTVGHLSHPLSNKEYASSQPQEDASGSGNDSGNGNGSGRDSVSSSKASASGMDKNSARSSVSTQSPNFSFGTPWSKDNLKYMKQQQQQSQQSHQQQTQNANSIAKTNIDCGCPDLVSGSSTSTTPLDDNILVSPDSNKPGAPNITRTFEEQMNPFCAQLSEVCGTKSQPCPKERRSTIDINKSASTTTNSTNFDSPFSNLSPMNQNNLNDAFFNHLSNTGESDLNFNLLDSSNNSSNNNNNPNTNDNTKYGRLNSDDPLSFLNDATGSGTDFDISLAFADNNSNSNNNTNFKSESGQELDPLAFLTTEDSIYDFTNKGTDDINTNFNFNDFIKQSIPERRESVPEENDEDDRGDNSDDDDDDDDDDNAVVPAPQSTLKCSEIWDRITAHPRYTELDIDGLCNELKNKAKCSEKGVVINTTDVNELLSRSMKE
ncbi:uncharacterized protein LODBEIA_P34520 [Lodderomyces beijingensis]|uniref:BZIP domain-containing protein n=1 Tax=Lodderomyces beijingensis TaxID=1775926 RepID=A0ABP0ZNH3_9ASCO